YELLLPLVNRIAKAFARRVPSHVSLDDLVSSAWVGLIEAFSRSPMDMPIDELEAYTSQRVKGAILDYLRGLDPGLRAARNASRRFTRAIARLEQSLGRPPSEDEIASALRLSSEELREQLTTLGRAGMGRLEIVDIDQI